MRILPKKLIRYGLFGFTSYGVYYGYSEEIRNFSVGVHRFGRAALTVLDIIYDYRSTLYSGDISAESSDFPIQKSKVHQRSAEKLLKLCCANGGAFIKVGQHLGSLEYLLPYEYVNTLKVLHSKAPVSPLSEIYKVIKAELKADPPSIFDEFDSDPLGAASLAQVHRARLKDGREVAVKVQYPTVLGHSEIDMKGMEFLVKIVSSLFSDFQFEWLVKEMKRNLPKELDFTHEANNAEKLARMFPHLPWLKIPSVDWEHTTSRVLTMEFSNGGQVDDLNYMKDHGIDPLDVSKKIGDLYSQMIFVKGFVHCDPHPGNILVEKRGQDTDIVLLDHGLYLDIGEKFRVTYSELWLSILSADLKSVEYNSRKLGLGDLFGLFACMVTGRSWDSISQGIHTVKMSANEEDQIKQDAAKYLPEIAQVLNSVPREMLLIFKTNDLLRGIEYSLNTSKSMKSFISMSRCCIQAVFDERRKSCDSSWRSLLIDASERFEHLKLSLYTIYLFILRCWSRVNFINL